MYIPYTNITRTFDPFSVTAVRVQCHANHERTRGFFIIIIIIIVRLFPTLRGFRVLPIVETVPAVRRGPIRHCRREDSFCFFSGTANDRAYPRTAAVRTVEKNC